LLSRYKTENQNM